MYERLSDHAASEAALRRAEQLQGEIWKHAETGTHGQVSATPVLNAVNEMIDVTTARTLAQRTHTPKLIVHLMLCLAFMSALIAG